MTREYLKREALALGWWIAAIIGPALVGYCVAVALMLFGVIDFYQYTPASARWNMALTATGFVWGIAGVALLGAAAHNYLRGR